MYLLWPTLEEDCLERLFFISFSRRIHNQIKISILLLLPSIGEEFKFEFDYVPSRGFPSGSEGKASA